MSGGKDVEIPATILCGPLCERVRLMVGALAYAKSSGHVWVCQMDLW
jgi:hypothetical protein